MNDDLFRAIVKNIDPDKEFALTLLRGVYYVIPVDSSDLPKMEVANSILAFYFSQDKPDTAYIIRDRLPSGMVNDMFANHGYTCTVHSTGHANFFQP